MQKEFIANSSVLLLSVLALIIMKVLVVLALVEAGVVLIVAVKVEEK